MDDLNRLLGRLEEHMDNTKVHMEESKEVMTKINDKLENVEKKADIAHSRIDKHEVKFSTLKWVAGLISAVMGGLITFFTGD